MLGVYEANVPAFSYQFYISRTPSVPVMVPYDPRVPRSEESDAKRAKSLDYTRLDFQKQLHHHYLITGEVDLSARIEKLVSSYYSDSYVDR